MNKYISDSQIKKNYIYEDKNGKQLLYLGVASQSTGEWSYNDCHIYIDMKRYAGYDAKGYSLEDILIDLHRQGIRHYFFSEKHRKFVKEIGPINKPVLRGVIGGGIFNFKK